MALMAHVGVRVSLIPKDGVDAPLHLAEDPIHSGGELRSASCNEAEFEIEGGEIKKQHRVLRTRATAMGVVDEEAWEEGNPELRQGKSCDETGSQSDVRGVGRM